VSLRLLYRVPPLLFINFISVPANLLFLVIFLAVTLFVHGMVQPFKGLPQNTLDGVLQLLLLLMAVFSLYFILLQQSIDGGTILAVNSNVDTVQRYQDRVAIVLLTLVHVACAIILIWHLMTVFPRLKKLAGMAWSKMTFDKFQGKKQKKQSRSSLTSNGLQQVEVPFVEKERLTETDSLSQTSCGKATFSELREPLLEDSSLAIINTVN